MDKLFEGIDDEGAKGVGDAYSELLDSYKAHDEMMIMW
jgi:hypothetical protein